MAADRLKTLHTSLIDARNGYQEAAADAETPALKALFAEMIALKERDHAELHDALRRMGETPDEAGSFMSTVHQTVIRVRSVLTGLGTNALSSFVNGEEQILGQYDDALKDCADDAATTATLTRQRQSLQAKIAQMKQLAA
ncbi:PA2169 family four-helix-bundle protein [Bradyrhizobium sp. 83002]|uniref:ferritin-like domain-containing protein n=1 Tax=Bradyrhizobium aeschynomenes TaxID=2734909 RepID=UPI00155280C1|nr:PA2169 family four-helix-bundle protein [Bradyrhizobium aeschynomenes]NPU13120.1 PA2169 family four-helix-bundle protein [Bradyrhizobium aeschynomenes]